VCVLIGLLFLYVCAECIGGMKQELSCRQQIARKLRTQYAEGIYGLKYYTVTLKSRLKVTGNGTIG